MNVTSQGIAVGLAVVVAIGLLFFGSDIFSLFTSQAGSDTTSSSTTMNQETPKLTSTIPNPVPTSLTITDLTVGTGEEIKKGDTISVNYVGALTDGTVFDSSVNRGPFSFDYGAGRVIAGWEQGLAGMKVGGKRFLVIPPALAYGSQDLGSIPPNSTLLFEVELLSVGE